MGHKWSYASPQEILLEIGDTNPFYTGLDWEELGAQGVRTQEQEVAHA
jgi:predicted molibdopterin-dependent oxidoreductase YjgC